MDTAICPACNAALPARGFFCPQCLTQARCKSCNELLEPNAKGCVVCGTPLGEGVVTTAAAANGAVDNHAPNMLRYEETRSGRKLEANLTDNAVQNLAEPINVILAMGTGMGSARNRRTTMVDVNEADDQILVIQTDVHETEPTQRLLPAPTVQLRAPSQLPEDERLRALFREEDGRLHLHENRLKGRSHLDQARRLIYLRLLHAHLFEDKEQLALEEINAIIQRAGWLNAKTLSRIFEKTQDFVIDGDSIGLRPAGHDTARAILKDVSNEKLIQPQYDGSRGKGGKKTAGGGEKAEGDDKKSARRAGTKLQSAASWLPEWKKLNLLPAGKVYDTLKDRPILDQGIFGLWAIRRTVGEPLAVTA